MARYEASDGRINVLDEAEESLKILAPCPAVRTMQSAAMRAKGIPVGKLDPGSGVKVFTLEPGERAVVPMKWYKEVGGGTLEVSTHPAAPLA